MTKARTQQAFTEFNQTKNTLESITGQRVAMNTTLINVFSHMAGATDSLVLASY